MKKFILFFAVIFMGQLSFAQAVDNSEKKIFITLIQDSRITGLMRNAFNDLACNPGNVIANCEIPSFREEDFDFENIYKSEKPGESEIAYSVKYRSVSSDIVYAFSVISVRGMFKNPMLIKANTDRSRIVYNELSENLALDIRNMNNSLTYEIRNVDYGGPVTNRTAGCGQCVANCIGDAYTNHGWASVWTFVQSIFIPATGVGITLGCIGRCCT